MVKINKTPVSYDYFIRIAYVTKQLTFIHIYIFSIINVQKHTPNTISFKHVKGTL